MWGREMRAGLLFVVVSVAAGGAFRGWQRAHHQRFDEIVASLVDASARDAASAAASAPPAGAADSGAAGSGGGPTPGAPPRARSAAALRPASIDVDRASAGELERLPGIGPALATRIVAERAAGGPFGGPEGLLRVRGIGAKTLEKIRPYLSP